ncbi:hypothetical protein J7T55_004049 [Diaporthe amygdali]|uniref:uncharacterized protein n=1 Tax=Phomopsis amygdali TaxID=1214568 RepID=UPI0022FDD16E|nr:uncharacterized protein J7T55_004049 [Diaporthe amygdali]KAJ0115880.1 hypothetical protein J7T55_004049 [Diaporthe amygdali]
MDSDSDFYGDEEEVAMLESRAQEFDVQAYWRHSEQTSTVHPGYKKESSSSSSSPAKAPALHNPYEGQVSAKQLNETIAAFLARLPPATTDVTPEIPWIYVANPFIPREGGAGTEEAPAESGAQLHTFIEGGGERLGLFGDFLRTVQEKKGGRASTAMSRQITTEREGCVNDVLMLARLMKVRTGKWMLFVEPAFVNDVWERVAQATVKNELGIAAKVAPREERGSVKERLVCIYTYDFRDKDDIARVLHRLRQLELVRDRAAGKPIYYKADAFTYLGIGYGNPWGMRASLYNSRDIFAYLKEKDGKASKRAVSKNDENEDEDGWAF